MVYKRESMFNFFSKIMMYSCQRKFGYEKAMMWFVDELIIRQIKE